MNPIITEKAVMLIEKNNTLTFTTDKRKAKEQIKKEFEEMFGVKCESIKTFIRNNKKYIYAKLKKEFPAIDVATKLGII